MTFIRSCDIHGKPIDRSREIWQMELQKKEEEEEEGRERERERERAWPITFGLSSSLTLRMRPEAYNLRKNRLHYHSVIIIIICQYYLLSKKSKFS